MEIWKPVVGYERYYEISNLGRVKSLSREIIKSNGVRQRRSEYIKKITQDADGYQTVGLCVNGLNKKEKVHTLVARAFVNGWFDGAEVNHKDFDRSNNNASNLEWVSHKDNVDHTIKAGRHISSSDISGKNNPNYGNHKLHIKYQNNKAYAREKQSRPGAKNGRALPVAMYRDDEYIAEFGYCGECARYLIANGYPRGRSVNSVATKVAESARSGSAYLGFTFRFI